MLETFDHAVVLVEDLRAAARDHALILGREPSWLGTHAELGTSNVLFRLANGYLELLAPGADRPFADSLRARLSSAGEGLYALALGTRDAARCASELRARGLNPSTPFEGSGRERGSVRERRWRSVFLAPEETRGVQLFAIEHLSPADLLPLAPTSIDEAATVSAFDHVVVLSNDADASRELYEDRLGLRLALDKRYEDHGSRLLFFRLGGMTIEIGASLDVKPDADATDRLWGMAYRVGDVARTRERIAQAGLDVSEVRTGRKAGTKVCTVRKSTHGVATLLIGPE